MLKRDLPIAVTAIVGVVVMLDFFVAFKPLNQLSSTFQTWGIIVGAFALGLASANLIRIHVQKLVKRSEDSFGSVILLSFLVGMASIGIAFSTRSPYYSFWFNNVYSTCHSAVSSLFAFFVVSASYRAFRVRNVEATLLLVAAALVMLGQAPVGEMLSPKLPGVYNWFMNVVNMAGQRGIMITSGIGAIAASLRVLLGLERGYMGQS